MGGDFPPLVLVPTNSNQDSKLNGVEEADSEGGGLGEGATESDTKMSVNGDGNGVEEAGEAVETVETVEVGEAGEVGKVGKVGSEKEVVGVVGIVDVVKFNPGALVFVPGRLWQAGA